MADHAAGETFALLRPAGMRRFAISNAKLGIERYYKGVTIGRSVTSADAQEKTFTDGGLKPFSPFDARVTRDGSNNITGTFQRRSRLTCRTIGALGISIPLGEQSESYDVTVYTDNTYATVATVITTTTTSFSFSATSQTFAGLTPGNTIYFEIQQRSAIVGLGYALRAAA
jgi:hypothetical protein